MMLGWQLEKIQIKILFVLGISRYPLMKICPYCKYENFLREDNCEKCNTSILEINHERFQFFEFLEKNWKYYSPIFAFLGLILINKPEAIYTITRLFFLALSIIFLVMLIKKASDYQKHFLQKDTESIGELYLFYIFQILVISVLIYNEVKPDPNGITTLPSFLLCLAYITFLKLLTGNIISDKSRLVSWIFVSFILSIDFFLVSLVSIIYFKDSQFDPQLYYLLVIFSFSIFFTFTGGIFAYCSMIFIHFPTIQSIKYLEFLFEENVPQKRILLQIFAGFTFLFTLILIPILYSIIFQI